MKFALQTPSTKAAIIVACVLAALLGLFGSVADEVSDGETAEFDHFLTMLLRDNGNLEDPVGPIWVEEAMRDITALGSVTVLALLVVGAVLFLLFSGRRRTALFLGVAVLSGTFLSNLLKALFNRPRPDVEAATRVFTASFPSGHATLSGVVFLTLGAIIAESLPGQRLRAYVLGMSIALTIMVGFSRIYLGMHFPTDVIAGWSLGASWALLCWSGYKLLVPAREP